MDRHLPRNVTPAPESVTFLRTWIGISRETSHAADSERRWDDVLAAGIAVDGRSTTSNERERRWTGITPPPACGRQEDGQPPPSISRAMKSCSAPIARSARASGTVHRLPSRPRHTGEPHAHANAITHGFEAGMVSE